MIERRFVQCDVFSEVPLMGNGLAVVVDGEGLSDREMQVFAAWTNLSETTYLLPPTHPNADYRVRIFTPAQERFCRASDVGQLRCMAAYGRHATTQANGDPRVQHWHCRD